MYKVIHLLVPRSPLTDPERADAFAAEWAAWAVELADLASNSGGFEYYVRTPRTDRGASLERFHGHAYAYEGVEVLAFHSVEAALEFKRRAGEFTAPFLDPSSSWFVAREHVLVNGSPIGELDTGPGIKVITSLRRLPGTDLEDFRRHWLQDHGPYVVATAGISRYIQNHVIDDEYRGDAPLYDGFVEVWHRTVADHDAAFKDPMMIEVQAADIPRFIDQDNFFTIQCTDSEQWVRGRRVRF